MKNSRKAVLIGICLIVTLVSLTSCAFHFSGRTGANSTNGERADTGFIVTGPESYDSADTSVVVNINRDDNTVTFLNLEVGKKYTLSLDGTTQLYDKYGENISLDQIRRGDIVDVTFLKSKKHLTSLQMSAEAWNYSNVERYEINTVRGEVTIGKEIFKLGENVQYFSGKNAIEEMDLNAVDVLSFQGVDKEVLSVNVEKGHGYLRLVNDEHFIGGWIEIGQSLIQHITEDMLLTVPEGKYQVNISHSGNGGVRNVVINRNAETVLDIGDMEIAEPKHGTILFSLSPSETKIYIDGEEVNTSQPVELEYGIHQLIAKAVGYRSITTYLRVGEETAAIDVVLDPIGDDEDEDESQEESTSETAEDTLTDYYKIYVDAPAGVEIYLDGNYVGISRVVSVRVRERM